MKLEWWVSLAIVFHFFSKTTCELISPEYERLLTLPSSELYQACLEENFQNCDLFNNEDIVKRSPKFNSWGGKRAQFSSWGGKRAPQFSSWGGKRAPQFSSWGGKRIPQYSPEMYDEVSDIEKKAAKFSNWGGKRNFLNEEKRAKFSNWGGKRAKFSNWGGKRTPVFFYEEGFGKRGDSIGYKRKPAFSSWGGKRSGRMEQEFNEEEDFGGKGHVMKKREALEETNFAEDQMTDMWKEFFDRISNPNFNKNNPIPRERPSEIAPGTSTRPPMTKKSPVPDPQIQHLFKQFVFWSHNRPESKKNELTTSFFKDFTMGNPVRRGNLDFYAWGGKRSESISQ